MKTTDNPPLKKNIKHVFSLQRVLKNSPPNIFIPKRSHFSQWTKVGLAALTEPSEVCFRLVDKQEIQTLNHLYRKKEQPTNVLSFPSELPNDIPQEIKYLGDIVICPEVLHEEALEQNKQPEAHWAHIVIHGLLHLLGYDHIHDNEATIMESLEIQLLSQLSFGNPYEENIHV